MLYSNKIKELLFYFPMNLHIKIIKIWVLKFEQLTLRVAICYSHMGKYSNSTAQQLLPPDAEVRKNDMRGWYENDVIVRTYLTSVIFIL